MPIAQLKSVNDLINGGDDALLTRCAEAVDAADRILTLAKGGTRIKIQEMGGIDNAQHSAHGLAWLATTVEALRQMHGWARRLKDEGSFGEFERLILAVAFAEYGAQIAGGIPMNQGEIMRPDAMGVARADVRKYEDAVADLIEAGSAQTVKSRLAELIKNAQGATTYGVSGLDESHAGIHESDARVFRS